MRPGTSGPFSLSEAHVSDFSQLLTDTADEILMLVHGDVARFEYQAVGGSRQAYEATVGPEEAVQSIESPGVTVSYKRAVGVRVADLAAIDCSGTAWVDGVEYSLTAVARASGGMWDVQLQRTTAAEISRDSYRRTR